MLKLELTYEEITIPLEIPKNTRDYYTTLFQKIKDNIYELSGGESIELVLLNTKDKDTILNKENFNCVISENIDENFLKIGLKIKGKNNKIEEDVMKFINGESENVNENNVRKVSDDDFEENIRNDNSNNEGEEGKSMEVNQTQTKNTFFPKECISKDENIAKKDLLLSSNLSINSEFRLLNDNENEILELKGANSTEEMPENSINKINFPERIEMKSIKKSNSLFNKNILDECNDNNHNVDKEQNYRQNTVISVFSDIKCDLCNMGIKGCKYQCFICDNLSLCEFCQKTHDHPCFKFKSKSISNLIDSFYYIKKSHGNIEEFTINPISIVKNMFENGIKVNIGTRIERSILVGINQNFEIPIIITNNSEVKIESKNFIVIARNYKWVNVKINFPQNFTINPLSSHEVILSCSSSNNIGKDNVTIQLYSNCYKFIEDKLNQNSIEFNIVVSKDEENNFFSKEYKDYPRIILLDKIKKKLIEKIITRKWMPDKTHDEIYDILKNNKWNVDDAVNYYNNKRKLERENGASKTEIKSDKRFNIINDINADDSLNNINY